MVFKERTDLENKHKWFITDYICLGDSLIESAGTGVFATRDIPSRTVIESAPVIIVARETFHTLDNIHPGVRNVLSDYPFTWENGRSAIAMGWGGLYNHSFEHNVTWESITEESAGYNALKYRTKRDIVSGEELLIRYTWGANSLWFIDGDVPSPDMSLRDQVKFHGSMGIQTSAFFADAKYAVTRQALGKETLSDYTLVTKKQKTED